MTEMETLKRGSKRQIRKALWNFFYDDEASEFTGTSFTANFIKHTVCQKIPDADWKKDIYYIIRQWQKSLDKLYDGIYNENKLLLEAGVTDTREICERKYQNALTILINDKIVPLYFDNDISEWRVAKSLQIYEEIIGDRVLKYHKLRNDNITKLAKKGGKLLSGIDSRSIIQDMYKDTKKLDDRS